MVSFYRYIFCKSYHFCINVFKEDEFPYFWATSSIVFLVFSNVTSALGFVKYLLHPVEFETYSGSYKYIIVGLTIVVNIYMYSQRRYLKHINFCNEISPKRAKIFRVLSILYYVITFYAFFKSSILLRSPHPS
ncbi:hypothetical protein DFO77_1044 [Marinilabilia salmonicolor]|uniref:Uncharacterized protein n=1 Tax=Marinilabilia salmonicolor TaxID=989 RepID=A0A368VAV1_9BACT|nr:hypothetical protein DFO77_1044 [Marinilabilia salmonicolor]